MTLLGNRLWLVRLVTMVAVVWTVAGLTASAASARPDRASTAAARAYDPMIADHTDPVAWTHNLSGATINRGSLVALNPLKFWIKVAADRGNIPLAVGIQEACEGQRQELLRFLKTLNAAYTMTRWTALKDVATCGGQDYGNAVYVIGGEADAVGRFTAQQANASEIRGYACARSAFGYIACTTHLICPHSCGDAKEAAKIRQLQFAQYFQTVAFLRQANTMPVYWGGDLYITPQNMDADILLINREADECGTEPDWRSTQDSTTASTGKADWLFLTEPVANPCVHDAFIWPTPDQDHHLVGTYHKSQ